MDEARCKDCGETPAKCVCCESCGHVCPLDMGEQYCPICLPEPGTGGGA
jgi:hypothetical protein